jgi:hypothetical protein
MSATASKVFGVKQQQLKTLLETMPYQDQDGACESAQVSISEDIKRGQQQNIWYTGGSLHPHLQSQ